MNDDFFNQRNLETGLRYAEIAVNEPVYQLFTYKIPPHLETICVGSLVTVPFGKRLVKGCVVRLLADLPEVLRGKSIRNLSSHETPDFQVSSPILQLSLWISEYYLSPPGEAIACASFIGFNDVNSQIIKKYTRGDVNEFNTSRLGEKQKVVLDYLDALPNGTFVTTAELYELGVSLQTVKTLLSRGILVERLDEVLRKDDYHKQITEKDSPLSLTEEQKSVMEILKASMDGEKPETFLIHGVTGSGKTEIYLQSIEYALRDGGEAIVLVPEIALTPQTVDRFRRRFGDVVGVYHSKMSLGQKLDLWKMIESGRVKIMIGARSAVFTPFKNLKIIVVDEEHEAGYKQDSIPRYHGRDVAIKRAYDCGAVAILGSATPSIETYYKALSGKFKLLTLKYRIDDIPMPHVEIIDMTKEVRDDHNTEFLSTKLLAAMDKAVERKDQVLLFLNRRGFFNFLICVNCKKSIQCRHCDIALTYHKNIKQILCHYCGREYTLPKHCPECETGELLLVGLGTQRLEEIVCDRYPQSEIIRMDLDTTRQKNAFIEAWEKIESGKIDIILGTQMIAKGIHLENVTVVGVPLADVSFYQPDFRAAERGFSLLTQVAGRAGRGKKAGTVYIQTYVPHHYAIQYAKNHDYVGFYQKEIRMREILRFPPFYRLISVLGLSRDQEAGQSLIKDFATILKDIAVRSHVPVTVLGPSPAPLSRINDFYRWRLLIRGVDYHQIRSLYITAVGKFNTLAGKSKLQIIPDVDPIDLM